MRHSTHRLLVVASVALACQAVLADGSVLRPDQVTEDAVLRALDPNAQDIATRTRSIRPSMSAGAAQTASAPSANLLITFPTGSAELTSETLQALTTVGKALQSDRLAGFAFRIEGHADPRGGDGLNQHLSEQRAQSVVAFLADKMGIGRERLNAVGKGSTELMNTTQPSAPENRRVTIVTTR